MKPEAKRKPQPGEDKLADYRPGAEEWRRVMALARKSGLISDGKTAMTTDAALQLKKQHRLEG